MAILITGGAGYIGSHTALLLKKQGYEIVIFDNLSNATQEVVRRVEKLVEDSIPFVKGDIRHKEALCSAFEQYKITSVIHFAGLKAVGESVSFPLKYYDNNINGTLTLLEVMKEYDCKSIVFSSSATVYGDPHTSPILENFPLSATNPYGRSKLFIEEILRDVYASDKTWKIVILRYFNPVGSHPSGDIGEDPNGLPNNLMPYISQTAVGKLESLCVFGDDYDTPDGTGVRDYIHVMDLAEGHVKAIEKIEYFAEVMTINLGTGQGYSVLDMIRNFEEASKQKVAYTIAPRRSGDIATCYADPSYAKEILDWEAKRDVYEMCVDTWEWQKNNPNGYEEK